MTRLLLILLFLLAGFSISAQQTFTVTVTSGPQFSPTLINAKVGDNITFNMGSNHPVLQVEESTWNSNGHTAMSGGFSFPNGSGTITPTNPGTIYFICANHVSSGMKGRIIVSSATGLPSVSASFEFDVYPNPANDYLYLNNHTGMKPISASIFDIAGKKLLLYEFKTDQNNEASVSVSDLKKGLYFISVSYLNKTYTRKFIKL